MAPPGSNVSKLTVLQLGHAIGPFRIAASPVAIIAGGYTFIAFGFTIMLTLLSTIFLQTPPSAGGYGFTPIRNAYCKLRLDALSTTLLARPNKFV